MTLDILICTINKGIVKICDSLMSQYENVHYIVAYQYTEERFLELIPSALLERKDVTLYKYKGEGLSSNRNFALEKATADLVAYADDDTRFLPESLVDIFRIFSENSDLDIAFFKASTYTGKSLKDYPDDAQQVFEMPSRYVISAIEIVARRTRIQNTLRFDERFGLGTSYLTCGEEEIWIEDAIRHEFKMWYFPIKIVETSTLLKKSLIYVDSGVQRSFGAISYYKYGVKAWWKCFKFALNSTRSGYCHFLPLFMNFMQGIRYMQRTK